MNFRFLCLILLGIFGTELLFAASHSYETGLSVDGKGRLGAHGLVSLGSWSFGLAGLFSDESLERGMIGVNGPFLSAGNLNDSGLAAEVRQADASALSRLKENTLFRADLRSYSITRYGLGVFSRERRYGVVWERRSSIDAGIIWGVPVQREMWILEILGEGGLLRPDEQDDEWYPEDPGHAGGPFVSVALRNRLEFSPIVTGITLIGSGGRHFRPGGLAAAACQIDKSPYRFRFRSTLATESYRSADGKRPDVLSGISGDFRYSQRPGLELSAGFEAALLYHPLARFPSREPGFFTLGWNFLHWRISGSIEWDGITVLPMFESVKMQLDGELHIFDMQYRFYYYDSGDWKMRIAMDSDVLRFLDLGVNAELYHGKVMLLNAGIKMTLSLPKLWISLNFMFRDLPRDWSEGPSSAGDFESGLRFIYKPGDFASSVR